MRVLVTDLSLMKTGAQPQRQSGQTCHVEQSAPQPLSPPNQRRRGAGEACGTAGGNWRCSAGRPPGAAVCSGQHGRSPWDPRRAGLCSGQRVPHMELRALCQVAARWHLPLEHRWPRGRGRHVTRTPLCHLVGLTWGSGVASWEALSARDPGEQRQEARARHRQEHSPARVWLGRTADQEPRAAPGPGRLLWATGHRDCLLWVGDRKSWRRWKEEDHARILEGEEGSQGRGRKRGQDVGGPLPGRGHSWKKRPTVPPYGTFQLASCCPSG